MSSRNKSNRNARIGVDVKQATKKKVAFGNEQGSRQLKQLEKESVKALREIESLKKSLKNEKDKQAATQKTLKYCNKLAAWVDKTIKTQPETGIAVASEMKTFTTERKSLPGNELQALIAAAFLMEGIRRWCKKSSGK